MDLDDINPIAVVGGLFGGLIGFGMIKYGAPDLSLIWKILTPIACTISSFFLVQKIAE